jgi:ADP-ribosylglycohydrolase
MKKLPALLMLACLQSTVAASAGKVTLNQADFRDRVYACWLGKNIGGTLGMPFEGKKEPNTVCYYLELKPGEPAANDDLDLQILWLKAMEENGARVDARILGNYWLKYVPVDWNEYGIGKANMKLGWLPPLSGEYGNSQWKNSNGAWIRSEIWACLAPGVPELAARLAREDACVDHGAAEGTLAELFTASIESAAFVEPDRDKLIDFGLSMIPKDCGVARAVRAAVAAKWEGKSWQEARRAVISATEDTGWFQAPRNIGYVIIGWLYGVGDCGKSICTAVNCGDDTDCTGATLGAILGILGGTKAIPERWRLPIGTKIKTVAVSGFPIPPDLGELTHRTVAMTKKVLAANDAPVEVADGPTDLREAGEILSAGPKAAPALWRLSPYQIVWKQQGIEVNLDYLSDPVILPGVPRSLSLKLANQSDLGIALRLQVMGLPEDWRYDGLPTGIINLKKWDMRAYNPRFLAPKGGFGTILMTLKVIGTDRLFSVPLTLASPKK